MPATSAAMATDTPLSAVERRGSWDGLVVILSGNCWHGSSRLHERHMAERLAQYAPVLYVDPPISHLTRFNQPDVAAALARPRLRRVAPGIAQYTPIVAPKPLHALMTPLTQRIVRRGLASAIRQLGGSVHAVVSTWLLLDGYSACGEARRVYWWTDDPIDAAALWGRDPDRLAAGERRVAEASDLIVAVNEEVAEGWRERGFAAACVPNGCDDSFFGEVDSADEPTDVRLPRPIAGFVGTLNARTDLSLLEAVADTETSLLIVGPRDRDFEPGRFERLVDRPNVAYVGPRPFEQLLPYIKLLDVGLVPYADTRFNRGSFPIKTLEYLAAGRPVVSTPLPATLWLDTDLVTLGGEPDEFAAGVLREVAGSHDAAVVERRREFASSHTWAGRAEALAELLEVTP